MSRSSLFGLLTATLTILLITLGLGQGCSSDGGSLFGSGFQGADPTVKVPGSAIFAGSNGNGGGYSGMNGNGGGYSGLQSVSQGAYDPRSNENQKKKSKFKFQFLHSYRATSSILEKADELYLQIEAASSCHLYQSGWNMAGPNINGLLAVDMNDEGQVTSVLHFTSACLSPLAGIDMLSRDAMTVLDFDPSVAIYGNKIYQLTTTVPPAVESLNPAVAYCRSEITKAKQGADLGLSVLIYRRGQQLLGVINYGRQNTTNDGTTRFAVPAFAVEESRSENQATYKTSGFELGVTTAGAKPSLGSLFIQLDGQESTLAMKCWH